MARCRSASRRYVQLNFSSVAVVAFLCLTQLAIGRAFASFELATNAANNWNLNDSASLSNNSTGALTTERPVVNPHDFRYVLNNPDLCHCSSGNGPDMLVWVHTAPLHFKRRMLLRETWGNPMNFPDCILRMVFFVGDPQNGTVQALLRLEAEKYGDIVQENFVDSYRNLTYKAIMGLKWVHTYCSGARMILKVDDDVLADIFRIVRHVRALQKHKVASTWTILCNRILNARVKREGKWAVSTDEYPDKTYPPYCSGMAVLMTPDLVYPLYVESLETRFLWVDDVYFSGILAQKVKANFHPLSAVISIEWLGSEAYAGLESDHVFVQVNDPDSFLILWNKMATMHFSSQSLCRWPP